MKLSNWADSWASEKEGGRFRGRGKTQLFCSHNAKITRKTQGTVPREKKTVENGRKRERE